MVDAAHLWCRESVDSGGGLAGWQRDDLLLEEGAVELPEGEFNATFNPEAVVKVTDVLLASHENTAQIIDARPAARFNAEVDEPRQVYVADIFPARLTFRGQNWYVKAN